MSVQSIVLLSGALAVGKTAVREELTATHGYAFVRSSQYLRQHANSLGQSASRESLQETGDRLDVETDYRWIIDDVALPAMAEKPTQTLWIVDAVRKKRQIEHFRASLGSAIFHVHLDADAVLLKRRYEERQLAQGNAADPTPYEKAIDHENERSARGLSTVADLVLDVSQMSPQDAARRIVAAVERSQSA